jgi:hypothetical protein
LPYLFFRQGLMFLPKANLRPHPPIYSLLHSWDTGMCHHDWLVDRDKVLLTFPGLALYFHLPDLHLPRN